MSRSKGIPLYQQIQQYLIQEINSRNLGPDHKLPSESEIAGLFKVSRLTVKNALKDFVNQGAIYRIQGKGTFLASNFSGQVAAPPRLVAATSPQSDKLVACLLPVAFTTRTLNLLNGIEERLAKHGYRMIFVKTNQSREVENRLIQEMLALKVAGMIIYPVEAEAFSEEVLRLTLNHYPLVVVDRYLRGVETNCVSTDNVQGAMDAVNHLIELGHTQIGFIATPHKGISSIEDRLAGYELALSQHNFPIDHRLRHFHLVTGKVNSILHKGECDGEIKHKLQQFLQQNPSMTAVMAINSSIGLSVIQAAAELGLRIPEDLSVIFFDDYELSGFSRIPPTVISQQEYLIGAEAAELVVSLIDNPNQARRKSEIPARLIVRQSTGTMNEK